jgi:hypothetical protein
MDEADQTFDEEFLDYARRALEMAGIETDPRLKAVKPLRHSLMHAISEQSAHYRSALKLVPQSGSHWEMAQFIGQAVRAAIWDLQWGSIRSYDQFEFLYRRILGEESVPYLRSVFAAAALSPGLTAEFSNELKRSLPEASDSI